MISRVNHWHLLVFQANGVWNGPISSDLKNKSVMMSTTITDTIMKFSERKQKHDGIRWASSLRLWRVRHRTTKGHIMEIFKRAIGLVTAVTMAALMGCGGGGASATAETSTTTKTATAPGMTQAVEAVMPRNGSTEVSSASPIQFTFKTDMTPTTVNTGSVSVKGPAGALSGTVSYNAASKTATFVPLIPLRTSSSYVVIVSSAALTAAGTAVAPFTSRFTTAAHRDLSVAGDNPLRERAAGKGLLYGASTATALLTSPTYAAAFARECGILVPESQLKWNVLRPTSGTYNFEPGDALLDFALRNKMLFRGHTLVWHAALPAWFQETVTPQTAEEILRSHIATVVGHYAGKVHSWDVVNEAIEVSENAPDGLRVSSPWYQLLGRTYIDIAFRAAAAADPKALLVYNEYGLDDDSPEADAKRAAVLKLLTDLKKAGTPIHALGVQAHLDGTGSFNPQKLRSFLSQVASIGLKILISEMDVTDDNLPNDVTERDEAVAGVYSDYLSVALKEPAVIAVLTWGLSDPTSWLTKWHRRSDGTPIRPLPLDAAMTRKPAWNGIAKAIDGAGVRQ
jgi:endo-1,4-beta-xylanase